MFYHSILVFIIKKLSHASILLLFLKKSPRKCKCLLKKGFMASLFNSRIAILISEHVGKHNKQYSNNLDLAKKAGISDGTISKLKIQDIKNPDTIVLRKLSRAFNRDDDYLYNLWLFSNGQTKFDPEISYQINKLFKKKLSLRAFFDELFLLIYKTKDKEKLIGLLKEEFNAKQVNNYHFDDFVDFAFNATYSKNSDEQSKVISLVLCSLYSLNLLDLFNYLDETLKKETRNKDAQFIKDTQKSMEPFRYPSDNYEQRPVFKATGGKMKQYIADGFTGENGRLEWGYFKDMPRGFFVEVEGNSMIGAGIKDKDYCLINPHVEVKDGDIVLAVNGNTEATIKKFKKTTTGIFLSPSNPDFEPIFIESKEVEKWQFFKVVESRHKF